MPFTVAPRPGRSRVFADATKATARAMVGRDVELVYGGGRLGLMGLIADTVLEFGGQVYGVIPARSDRAGSRS